MTPTIEEATHMVIMAARGWAVGGIVAGVLCGYLVRLTIKLAKSGEYDSDTAVITGIGAFTCGIVWVLALCYVYDGFTNTSLNAKQTIAQIEGLRNIQRVKQQD